MASILMVAGEGLPFIKTGGLADVIGSLPKALTERGHEVKVVMPLYKKISDKYYNELHFDCEYSVSINYHEVPVRVFSKVVDNVCFFFIQHQGTPADIFSPLYTSNGKRYLKSITTIYIFYLSFGHFYCVIDNPHSKSMTILSCCFMNL